VIATAIEECAPGTGRSPRVRIVVAVVVALAACRGEPPPGARTPVAAAPCPAAPIGEPAPVEPEPVASPCPGAEPVDHLTLTPADFTDLPGWSDDDHAEAVPAFLASCGRLAGLADRARVGVDGKSGTARQWRAACAAAAKVPAGDAAAARAFFEREFRAYAAAGDAGPEGKMTGYYVQTLRGSRRKHGAYAHPVYARPPDLVAIDLEDFIADARGRRIWGRLAGGAVVPYATRKQIRGGALAGKGLELFWSDDPVDVLFTQIQGSGKMTLDDGTVVWLAFAGKNGRPYRGVGRVLRDLGEPPGTGTMPGIRAWFAAHPDRFDEIADKNEAFVFFSESPTPGAIGSQLVVLTPRRSLAVDRAFVAASTPIWVDTRAPRAGAAGEHPWRHLVVAQDTGGGIKGPVRGDIYFGADDAAADVAGRTGGPGRYWLLLPRAIAVK
jgi:membrane-bound lytic murein transglycosylase A